MRFVISDRQILKSETNEVRLIKKSYVEEENSLSSLNTNVGGSKDLFFLNSDIPRLGGKIDYGMSVG